MNSEILDVIDQYIATLEACLKGVTSGSERRNIVERLSEAAAMRSGDLGGVASILYGEERSLGWEGIYTDGGDAVHAAFRRLVEAVKAARLAARPDAGFGH